jgi:hypothetical protein
MDCQIVLETLSDYLDGALLGSEGQLIEGHLGQCRGCQSVRLDLMEIRRAARELPLHTPPRAMWARLQLSLEAEVAALAPPPQVVRPPGWWTPLMKRRFTFTLPQLAGGGALVVALMIFVFVNVFHQNARSPLDGSVLKQASTALLPGEEDIKRDIEYRMKALKARQETWDPQMREIFERNLTKIDDSLTTSRQMLLDNPHDSDHQQMVLTLYKEKLQLLQDYDRLK